LHLALGAGNEKGEASDRSTLCTWTVTQADVKDKEGQLGKQSMSRDKGSLGRRIRDKRGVGRDKRN